ncbi:MAG: extracellular solute-binding protein [Eubacteriales bacterium]|nr:extracellular solute-binding protein [Eubacteriales bacterium]
MSKLKHIFSAVIIAALMAGSIAGCTSQQSKNIIFESQEPEEQSKTNLTFFGFKYEALNVMAIETSLHSFMDENPEISISYDGIKSPEYFNILEKRLDSGNGDDIFMVDHARVLELREQGKLADLSDLSAINNFSDLARSQMDADATIDYLPTSISAFGLYCNTDLLKKHDQKVPENLRELESVCDYFVSRGITPIVANNDISLKTVVLAKSMLPVYQQEDSAGMLKSFNTGQADLAETLRPGFELTEKMLERGWVNPAQTLETSKTKDDLVLFAKGEQPFMLTGAWAVPRLRELTPDFDFQVVPYPVMEDGSVLVINVDTRISVNADSPHLEESKKFVEYLTQNDSMWEFVNSQSSFSPLKENRLADDEAIQSMGPYLTNGRSVIGSDDNLLFPIWEMTRQCVTGMLNGDSAEEAVSNMKKQLNEFNIEEQR